MIYDEPLGVGLRNFKAVSDKYGVRKKGIVVHNAYLEIGTGAGLHSLLVFLFIDSRNYFFDA